MKRSILTLFMSTAFLLVPLASQANNNNEEFYGFLESRPTGLVGTWTIGGRSVQVTADTEIDTDEGPLVVGACVKVEYENGKVEEIETQSKDKCTEPMR